VGATTTIPSIATCVYFFYMGEQWWTCRLSYPSSIIIQVKTSTDDKKETHLLIPYHIIPSRSKCKYF